MHFLLVIVLSLHVGYSLRSSDAHKHGSHNLLKLENSNNSVQRPVRCTPCEQGIKTPVSNHLDPEYRGNGADNLGYDWSPMAWGGPAFPRRSKVYMGGMRGRDGRMMSNDGGRSQGNVKVICDTCRTYWDGAGGGGRDGGGRGGFRGRQFDLDGGQNYYGGQPGRWQGGARSPEDYEARVMSPTVGVLVKPGSRIAYIPSRSGEMYWDGVSGGGTRWDGFSNGISWIGNAPSDWDRSDTEPRDGSMPLRPGGSYPRGPGPGGYGSWSNQNRPQNWGDSPGRGYYFSNGVPNDIDPLWRDRGYASNWHYGSTNQNGWNGSNMKWNYGGKQWADNDRAANRFYFNTPQDRAYGPSDGHRQYGNQYPNYQPSGYPSNFRPQPWPTGGSFRPNDRFPSNFQQGDNERPWDYTSRDPFGQRRPGPRPEWARPGPSYPAPANFVGNYGKYPNEGYDKFSPSDKNDFEKPWTRPSGYGPSKPGSGDGFPYGGNRYPDDGSGGSGRPGFPSGGGHLFYPNDGGNPQPSYSTSGSGSGDRPGYQNGNRKPDEYPGAGSQGGSYPGDGGRPDYQGDKRPSVIYTGGRPSGGFASGGSSSGGYPSSGGSTGGYPGGGSSSGSYPSGGSPSGGYPGGGSSSGGYPGGGTSSGGYPSSGSPSGGYPSGGSPSGGYPAGGSGVYPTSGSTSGGYPVTDSTGGYPSGGGSRPGVYPGASSSGGSRPGVYPGASSGGGPYPSGGSRPGGYPSGGSYPASGTRPDKFYGPGDPSSGYPGGSGAYPRPGPYPSGGSIRPGFTPDGGYPSGYFGSRPVGYPSGVRPGGYGGDGSRPDEYPIGIRPGYPIRGSYPGPGAGGPGGSYPQGTKNPPKGYYTGFITELGPDDGQSPYGGKNPNYFGSSYPGDKNYYPGKDRYYNGGNYPNGYPSDVKNRYPAFSEDRYSISGGGGGGGGGSGGYPTGENDRGRDKYYYGQSDGKGKYPNGFPSNHRFPNGGGDDYDRNQSSSSDKNTWNYGQNEHKEGIYRRSGGSYPPYRGGQYYTSSYLASMSTTAGSTQAGSEQKTQSVTKTDEVTQPTSDSS